MCSWHLKMLVKRDSFSLFRLNICLWCWFWWIINCQILDDLEHYCTWSCNGKPLCAAKRIQCGVIAAAAVKFPKKLITVSTHVIPGRRKEYRESERDKSDFVLLAGLSKKTVTLGYMKLLRISVQITSPRVGKYLAHEASFNAFKQEPVNDDAELEFVQVDDALSVDEMSFEQGTAEDSRDALVMFSGDELVRCDRSVSSSKGDIGQRRRLRFSEADDMVLLRRVVELNPYKCSALWKDVTQMVAMRTGKNFSVRSIREHTDLLMNTYSLRGLEACLKRSPPELREKKKQLLQKVLSIWKKDSHSAKVSNGSIVIYKRPGKELAADNHLEHQDERGDVEADNSDADPISDSSVAKSSSSQPVTSRESLMPSVSKTPSLSLLIPQQSSPVKLQYSTPASSVTYPPLLASGLPSNIHQLALSARMGLQKLAIPPAFPFSGWGRPVLSKLVPTPPSRNTPLDPAADSILPDQPLPLISKNSSAPSVSPASETVDQSTSPILSLSGMSTKDDAVASSESPIASDTLPSEDSADVGNQESAAVTKRSERKSDCSVTKRIPRTSSLLRAKLHFLQARHRDEYTLRVKELNLRKQRLALEARKLDLEERKVRLEEEKWKVERKEREEKLLLIAEERQNKMALERRQQNMIDILLELKKKE